MSSTNNLECMDGVAEQFERKEIRTYKLLNPEFRKSIDLRQYEGIIVDAVFSAFASGVIQVRVSEALTRGLRSASVVAEQKSTGLLATHTDALKTHSSQSFSPKLLEAK